MAERRLYNEIRRMAKVANERIRQLEKRDMQSPAYQAVQAHLEMMGIRTTSAKSRRFSETGKYTYSEAKATEKALKDFLGAKTSTVRGYKEYRQDVLDGLDERYHYEDNGLSDDDMMEIFESLPDRERDRMYGSDDTVTIIMTAVGKAKKNEQSYDIGELVEHLQSSRNEKDAYKKLGITWEEVENMRKSIMNYEK